MHLVLLCCAVGVSGAAAEISVVQTVFFCFVQTAGQTVSIAKWHLTNSVNYMMPHAVTVAHRSGPLENTTKRKKPNAKSNSRPVTDCDRPLVR